MGEKNETKEMEKAPTSERVLVLQRIVDAPREQVFKAWTDPEILSQWWGPHGMTTPVCEMDLRPGGVFRTVMRDQTGNEYPTHGVFLEIVEPEKLVFSDSFDEDFVPRADTFLTAILTLEDRGGKTLYTATALHKSVEDKERHEQMGFHKGWGECLDKLQALLIERSKISE